MSIHANHFAFVFIRKQLPYTGKSDSYGIICKINRLTFSGIAYPFALKRLSISRLHIWDNFPLGDNLVMQNKRQV